MLIAVYLISVIVLVMVFLQRQKSLNEYYALVGFVAYRQSQEPVTKEVRPT